MGDLMTFSDLQSLESMGIDNNMRLSTGVPTPQALKHLHL